MRRCRQSSFYAAGVKLAARQATWSGPGGKLYFVVPGRARAADELSVHDLPAGALLRLVGLPARFTVDRDGRPRRAALDLAGIPPLPFDPATAWGRAGQRTLDLAALEAAAATPLHFAALLHTATAALSAFTPGSPYATALADAWLAHAALLPSPWRSSAERLAGVFTHCSPSSRRVVVADLVARVEAGPPPITDGPGPITRAPIPDLVVAHLDRLLLHAGQALRAELLGMLAPHLALLEDDWSSSCLERLAPVLAQATSAPERVLWREILLDGAHGRGVFAVRDRTAEILALASGPGSILSPADCAELVTAVADRVAAKLRTGAGKVSPWALGEQFARAVAGLAPPDRDVLVATWAADQDYVPLIAASFRTGLADSLTADQLLALQGPLLAATHAFGESYPLSIRHVLPRLPAGGPRTDWVLAFLADRPAASTVCTASTVSTTSTADDGLVRDTLAGDRASAILGVLPSVSGFLDEPGLCEVLDRTIGQLDHPERRDPDYWPGQGDVLTLAMAVSRAEVTERAWSDPTRVPGYLARTIRLAADTRATSALRTIAGRLPDIVAELDPDGAATVLDAIDEVPTALWPALRFLPLRCYGVLGDRIGDPEHRLDEALHVAEVTFPDAARSLVELLPELARTLPSSLCEHALSRLLRHPDEAVRLQVAEVTRDVVAELDLRRVRAQASPSS